MNATRAECASLRGEGAYLYDLDGYQYVDYIGSWGPLILGHVHPRVVAAVEEAVRRRRVPDKCFLARAFLFRACAVAEVLEHHQGRGGRSPVAEAAVHERHVSSRGRLYQLSATTYAAAPSRDSATATRHGRRHAVDFRAGGPIAERGGFQLAVTR